MPYPGPKIQPWRRTKKSALRDIHDIHDLYDTHGFFFFFPGRSIPDSAW